MSHDAWLLGTVSHVHTVRKGNWTHRAAGSLINVISYIYRLKNLKIILVVFVFVFLRGFYVAQAGLNLSM